MIQCCPAHFSASALYRPPRDTCSNYFMNKIFVISRLITKFTKILCHENLELYGTLDLVGEKFSTPHLSSFTVWWVSLFSHGPNYFGKREPAEHSKGIRPLDGGASTKL